MTAHTIIIKELNMTEKLYYKDSYIKEFDACVLYCEKQEDKYILVLDKTAFFPEEGGQTSDEGYINDAYVSYVKEKNGVIYHTVDKEFHVNDKIHGKINFDHRYYNMQHHTGEHILSGLANALFLYENVGFHLSKTDMTLDLSGELSYDDIKKLEYLANLKIYECLDVKAYFPSSEELKNLNYRSKLDLYENVRIVEIKDTDICACCAPHVKNTGEIGIIKILDYIRYKGGMRLHVRCGLAALYDYRERYESCYDISTKLSVKQEDVTLGVQKLLDNIDSYKGKIAKLKRDVLECKLKECKISANICIFEEECDMNVFRAFLDKVKDTHDGLCAIFAGNDKDGYKYIIMSKNIDLTEKKSELAEKLNCKGGGSKCILQGNCASTRENIEKYFE